MIVCKKLVVIFITIGLGISNVVIAQEDINEYIDQLTDKNPSTRRNAVLALGLGEFNDKRIVKLLITTLYEDDAIMVRKEAARMLGGFDDKNAFKALVDTLRKDSEDGLRMSAAWALGNSGNKQSVKPLIAALRDEDTSVRYRAAEALGKLGDNQAVKPLINALQNESADVQKAIAEALVRLNDSQAVEPLITALQDKNLNIRAIAAYVLGELGDKQAVEPLIAALQKESFEGELVIPTDPEMNTLLGAPNDSQVAKLITSFKVTVRTAVVEALGKLGDSQAIETLTAALQDENELVRKRAKVALEKIERSK